MGTRRRVLSHVLEMFPKEVSQLPQETFPIKMLMSVVVVSCSFKEFSLKKTLLDTEHFKHKRVETVKSTTSFRNPHGRATKEPFIPTRRTPSPFHVVLKQTSDIMILSVNISRCTLKSKNSFKNTITMLNITNKNSFMSLNNQFEVLTISYVSIFVFTIFKSGFK